jgi:ABC-2 type transport system ATP-binding protein
LESALAVLQTTELTRRFGTKVAVNAVNITVESSESFALLGPNGAGKTTLIKMPTTLLLMLEGGKGEFELPLDLTVLVVALLAVLIAGARLYPRIVR